jgi:hypothetical protein
MARAHQRIEELKRQQQGRKAAIGQGFSVRVVGRGGGRRSNPRLRFFRPPLNRLSYQPK